MSEENALLYEQFGKVVKLTLNRPTKRNAMNHAIIQGLHDAFDRIAVDDRVSVVVIGGAGEKAFTAGFDLKEAAGADITDVMERRADTRNENKLWMKMWNLHKPIITMIHGYTIGGVDLPHIVLQPMLRPEGQPGYKTEQLNPLCCLVFDPDILIVSEKSPFKSFGELIEYAKANPGKVKAATVGKLTGDHIFLMNVEKFTGAQFTQVPYPGGSKAAPALLGGEVDCYFASTSNFLRMQGARGLAIATKDRYELCPDVPTMNELGYKLESAKYRGLATPPNFPAEAQAYLEAALAKVCADPEYQAGVRGAGLLPYYKDGKAFGEIIEQEKEKARKTLKEQGLIQ